MAKAKPVHQPEPPVAPEVKDESRTDPRRPVLEPEVVAQGKPKKVTKVGETTIEDY